jgi:hypothetical protein
MDRTRVRFTLRTMLVLVAIAAVPLAGIARSRRLAAIAKRHRIECASILDRADAPWNQPVTGPGLVCGNAQAREWAKLTDEERDGQVAANLGGRDTAGYRLYRRMVHHDLMAMRYREAARRPWFPVEPDPPGPE